MHSRDAFRLTGQHVVVVGASSGIGRAVALRCAEAGATVSVCARREEALTGLVAELEGEGHGHAVLDVRDLSQIESAFDASVERAGPIDGLVFASGLNNLTPLHIMSESAWDTMADTNLKGAAFCLRAALSGKRRAKERLSVVMLSSIGANRVGGGAMTAYSASKAGLEGLVRAAAVECGGRGVRVNAVAPGLTRTPMLDGVTPGQYDAEARVKSLPIARLAEPDEAAFACVYLLSPAASFITGETLNVDGGYACL